jgi:hypothetical protein
VSEFTFIAFFDQQFEGILMTANTAEFFLSLNENPQILADFKRNPEAVVNAAGLDDAARQQVLNGGSAAMGQPNGARFIIL